MLSLQENLIFKQALRAQSDIESERLRSELRIATTEHQVRFARLHEKRAKVIAELYALLIKAYWEISSFVSPAQYAHEPDKKKKYVTAMNSVADFYQFFELNKIYLPVALCESLDTFVQAMRQKAIGFGVYVHYEDDRMPPEAIQKKHDAWVAANEHFTKEVPIARAALENELRSILGAA